MIVDSERTYRPRNNFRGLQTSGQHMSGFCIHGNRWSIEKGLLGFGLPRFECDRPFRCPGSLETQAESLMVHLPGFIGWRERVLGASE